MRTVIFSDLHANYDALEGMLADLGDLEVDRFVCLGDVVGYYADPQKCVDKLRKLDVHCIQGNHDGVASGLEEPTDFNPVATGAILWTREQLDPEARKWLGKLPTQTKLDAERMLVHGSLRDRDEYILTRQIVEDNFEMLISMDGPFVTFFGHTHRRAVYTLEKNLQISLAVPEEKLTLERGCYYLINPGGTGQPRDGIPGAPYIIVEDNEITFRRAQYNVKAAAEKIEAQPFGPLLAERLLRGL